VGDVDSSVPPISPGPRFPCGIHSAFEADQLVSLGDSVALIDANITQAPSESNGEWDISIASYSLVGGTLPAGAANSLQESAIGSNFLAPGEYLLLLGVYPDSKIYFVSEALRGSFIVKGTEAYEQCPNYDVSGATIIATSGITNRDDLVTELDNALMAQPGNFPRSAPGS
jgi:hypothetical protein